MVRILMKNRYFMFLLRRE
ncbi:hypothetical protein PVPAM_120005000 [Plasmodium vivax]|nr:hypothetical protein PVPAM_120005000 [Plasmodium vivax]